MDSEVIKILEQFRDRQGNSKDDIEAFDITIKELKSADLKETEAYKKGYDEGFEDAKQLYS